MTKGKIWGAKMNVGTDESFLKLKFSQEITDKATICWKHVFHQPPAFVLAIHIFHHY